LSVQVLQEHAELEAATPWVLPRASVQSQTFITANLLTLVC
jgi:hypothetical protein